MIFSALKRLFGLESNLDDQQKSRTDPSLFRPPSSDQHFGLHGQSPPFVFSDLETDMNRLHDMMDQQMRSILGSFGSIFGPGPQFGGDGAIIGEDAHPGSSFFFSFPRLPGFPGFPGMPDMSDLPGLPGIQGPQIPGHNVPALPAPESEVSPRDEVLKPQFRKNNPNEMKDVDLDDLVREKGPGVVLDIMKPEGEMSQPLHTSPPSHGGFTSSTTITVYSNINGKSTMERIIVHPDQRVERYRMENDESGQPQLQ